MQEEQIGEYNGDESLHPNSPEGPRRALEGEQDRFETLHQEEETELDQLSRGQYWLTGHRALRRLPRHQAQAIFEYINSNTSSDSSSDSGSSYSPPSTPSSDSN